MPARTRLALIGAGTGAGLLLATWYLAFHVGVFKHADQSIFLGFAGLHRARVDHLLNLIADLGNPHPFVFFAACVLLVGLVRRRPRITAAAGAILLAANVTTQLLKPLLAQHRAASLFAHNVAPVVASSWPSGHATAAMSLALSAVIVAPSRWRPRVAALGAAFAVAVSYSFLALGWHYPSDVFGGFLIAGSWTALAVAAVSYADQRWPRRIAGAGTALTEPISIRKALGPPVATLVGVLGLAGIVLLARPHAVVSYARGHEAFMVGAGAIGALGLVLATALMLALRR